MGKTVDSRNYKFYKTLRRWSSRNISRYIQMSSKIMRITMTRKDHQYSYNSNLKSFQLILMILVIPMCCSKITLRINLILRGISSSLLRIKMGLNNIKWRINLQEDRCSSLNKHNKVLCKLKNLLKITSDNNNNYRRLHNSNKIILI